MLKIYGVPISVHTRKVIVAAIIKNVPFEVQPVVPVIPGNPPPEWPTLSPTGKIPAIVDGDFELADSTAICAYLDESHPPAQLYPADPRGHARALWFEQYAGGTVFRDLVHPLFTEVFVQPQIRKVPTNQARVDEVLTRTLPELLGYLEGQATDTFLTGPTMSVCDVAVVSNLINMQYVGFALDENRFPRLSALFRRVILQPAVQQAVRAEQAAAQAMGLNNACVQFALG